MYWSFLPYVNLSFLSCAAEHPAPPKSTTASASNPLLWEAQAPITTTTHSPPHGRQPSTPKPTARPRNWRGKTRKLTAKNEKEYFFDIQKIVIFLARSKTSNNSSAASVTTGA